MLNYCYFSRYADVCESAFLKKTPDSDSPVMGELLSGVFGLKRVVEQMLSKWKPGDFDAAFSAAKF